MDSKALYDLAAVVSPARAVLPGPAVACVLVLQGEHVAGGVVVGHLAQAVVPS
eukprot:CAMPEP_0201102756 /NCGR_PEP_ID=MMETSP0812-20130820/19864_1 /ASSEMBLY_ACC=CAM_ASM_000668 /TAXON_ID=98059 /ORGANISM="Dinobryon sp., Strain UTEXLB2267" /LENGTH=52 /DNA_ID=CAMNT_0047360449 /DNA_START=51 /DNA_END=209 /DNA_ORIENTATION=-